MNSDTLTSRDRVLRTIRFEPTDRVPVAPYMYDVAAQYAGMPLRQFYSDGRKMARAQLALHRALGHDVIAIGCDNYYIAEGFGCRTTHAEDELPTLSQPAMSSLDELFELGVPDPMCDGRMPVMLEAIREVKDAVGDTVAVRSPGTGPFALASYFVGSERWLYEIALIEADMPEANEAAIRHALKLATQALIKFGIACARAGADILHCGDSLASCNVISPATYRKFAFPCQRDVFAAWKRHTASAGLLHICGDSTAVLDQYAQTGADVIEVDHAVDLTTAKETVGQRAALMGNLHPVTELLQGDCERVDAAARRCVELGREGGGFILGSGCIVPRYTPLANLRKMIEVAHG